VTLPRQALLIGTGTGKMAKKSPPKKIVEKKLEKLELPTVNGAFNQGWRLCNTILGCGLVIFQGWSKGVGIYGNDYDFENKFFTLLWASKYYTTLKYPENDNCTAFEWWGWKDAEKGVSEAPIGVSMGYWQLLRPLQTYVASSTVEWVERFEKFVTKHKLGVLGKGHIWKNKNYKDDDNITFTWTWNGKCPKAKDVGIENWEYPE
jgi:hypothetical protein